MEPGVKRSSCRYWKAKLFSFFNMKLHPDWPWWPKDAVNLCNQLLKPSDIVIEFGSGRSTLWLGKRCSSLTSVEHNHKWYMTVKKHIANEGLTNINLIYSPMGENLIVKNPPYLATILDLDIDSTDIIIIDGKQRAFAALNSLSRLKHGGILIIDDAHRYLPGKSNSRIPDHIDKETWELVYHELKDWRKLRASDGIHATDFYFKS